MKVQKNQQVDRLGVAVNQIAFESAGLLFREQTVHDYGIDAHAELVEAKRPTGQLIGIQIKTGSSYFSEEAGDYYIYRSDDDHVQYWINHSLPVILTICDPSNGSVHWQAISHSTVSSTGKQWKIRIPKPHQVNLDSRSQLESLATRITPSRSYSILKHDDISVGIAKRYGLEVLINGTLTKSEIAAVVRQLVVEYTGSRYYRNSIVAQQWGDSAASIISLFVYLTLDDREDFNWICRCLWVCEGYPEDQPRPQITGENIGGGVVADWSSRYLETAEAFRRFEVSKEKFVTGVDEIRAELYPLMQQVAEALLTEAQGGSDSEDVLRRVAPEIDRLEQAVNDLGKPPVECKDVKLKMRSVISCAHDIVLPFLPPFKGERNKYVEQYSLEDYASTIHHLDYELEKVR